MKIMYVPFCLSVLFAACVSPSAKNLSWQASAPIALTEKLGFTEGPVWLPDADVVVFSEMHGRKLYQWSEKQGLTVFREDSGKGNGNILDRQGRLITCEGAEKQVTRLESNGEITVLASAFEGTPFNNPNDVAVGADGSIYFTDPNFGVKEGVNRQFLYRIRPDGTVEKAVPDSFDKPNGVAVSADGKIVYLNEGTLNRVFAYKVNSDGSLENTGLPLITGIDKVLDGLAVHPKTGDLFIAVYSNSQNRPDEQGIQIFSAEGEFKALIPVPGNTTNCCFDETGSILFVTSGGRLYQVDLELGGK